MTILSALASMVTPDPFPAALARLEQARANLETAKLRASDGTAQSAARAKEREAWPHLRVESGPYVGPASAAGDEEIATAKIALREAEHGYDAVEPRAEALRDRIRAARKQLANLDRDPRVSAIRDHVRALEELGVDMTGVATAALQKPVADELAAIAADLQALRAERRREGMPDPYLFSVERVSGECPKLSLAIGQIGMGWQMPILDALRTVASAGLLTLEVLDGAIAVLGTQAPSTYTQERIYLQHRKTARAGWEEMQRDRVAKDLADRQQGYA